MTAWPRRPRRRSCPRCPRRRSSRTSSSPGRCRRAGSTNASWTVDIADGLDPRGVAGRHRGRRTDAGRQDRRVRQQRQGALAGQGADDVESPVYTTIDSKPVLARGDGGHACTTGPATAPSRPRSSCRTPPTVQFFGTSPLVPMDGTAGASVVSGGELQAGAEPEAVVHHPAGRGRQGPDGPVRGSAVLEPAGQGPGQSCRSSHRPVPRTSITSCRPARAARWCCGRRRTPGDVIPAVHSTADGSACRHLPAAAADNLDDWQWVPDTAGKVAAWGECLIDFTTPEDVQLCRLRAAVDHRHDDLRERSQRPGRPRRQVVRSHTLAPNTARPWGLAGGHAIVVQNSVLFALDKYMRPLGRVVTGRAGGDGAPAAIGSGAGRRRSRAGDVADGRPAGFRRRPVGPGSGRPGRRSLPAERAGATLPTARDVRRTPRPVSPLREDGP